jgi:hypothetical protein
MPSPDMGKASSDLAQPSTDIGSPPVPDGGDFIDYTFDGQHHLIPNSSAIKDGPVGGSPDGVDIFTADDFHGAGFPILNVNVGVVGDPAGYPGVMTYPCKAQSLAGYSSMTLNLSSPSAIYTSSSGSSGSVVVTSSQPEFINSMFGSYWGARVSGSFSCSLSLSTNASVVKSINGTFSIAY